MPIKAVRIDDRSAGRRVSFLAMRGKKRRVVHQWIGDKKDKAAQLAEAAMADLAVAEKPEE